MPGSDSQEGQCGPFGAASALLPVPQRVNANAESVRKGPLGHPREPPQCGHVLPSLELATHEALALSSRHRATEIRLGQLRNVVTHPSPRYSRRSPASALVALRALMSLKAPSCRSV